MAIAAILGACSNSLEADESTSFWTDDDTPTYLTDNDSSAGTSSSKTKASSSSSAQLNYLPLNDTEYPYAGIPRIVIETENHRQILDRETEIPAKLQIYGKDAPESEIMELTIRGRGNSSWYMPKKSYKIELTQKQTLLGMPSDKDWALIANYADKSLIKNKITYTLGEMLHLPYSPKSKFIELYINSNYLGIYQLTETIKTGVNRVNISKKLPSFLVEIDMKYKDNEIVVFSNSGKAFRIHSPKEASSSALDTLKNHLKFIEECLETNCYKQTNSLDSIFALNEYIAYYWIQEFTKNIDGAFRTSVYFSWEKGHPISMGPLWDFDIAYGGQKDVKGTGYWYMRDSYWNKNLFKDDNFKDLINTFWQNNHTTFENLLDTVNTYKESLTPAAKNNFKRWPILQSTENVFHLYAYDSYENAVDALFNWIESRIDWISQNL